jgi:hypothetical protein
VTRMSGQWILYSQVGMKHGKIRESDTMSIGTILLILLILILIGVYPAWPHSQGWGYGPSGVLGVILLIVLILLLMGRL